MTAGPDAAEDQLLRTELAVGGMTCGACAGRVERKLRKLPGVTASVNYATEKATVEHLPSVPVDQLVATIVAAGYTAAVPVETADDTTDDLDRLAYSAVLAAPVIVLAMVPALQFDYWQWTALALTLPVVTWGAWPIHRAAWTNLRHGTATMDTLVSVGSLTALLYSLVTMLVGRAGGPGLTHPFHLSVAAVDPAAQVYLEVSAGVTVFVLLGRFLERRARRRAGAAVRELAELAAREAVVLRDGTEHRVAAAAVGVGDVLVVRPGETLAADGVVVEGVSALDVSTVTGESAPAEVAAGDPVTGGCTVLTGRLLVRADRVGADTQLARIAAQVERAQAGKAAAQRLADRLCAVFVPVVLALAVGTWGFWVGRGAFGTAFAAAAAVLVVACPCALGLATPTALLVGTGRAARRGILFSGPGVLDRVGRIDTVVLDKTGTLTTGKLQVVGVEPAPGVDAGEALRVAAALEACSAHPVAEAIRSAGAEHALPQVTDAAEAAGLGVTGRVGSRDAIVGRPQFLAGHGLALPAELRGALARADEEGRSVVAVGWDGRVRAVVLVADTVRPDAAAAVASLRKLGLQPFLLTGDAPGPARAVAAAVGIDHEAGDLISGALPHEKAEVVGRLQERGRTVAMIGDGVNDAAALARADLGIALGSGTDLAAAAADVTLVRDDLAAVPEALRLSRGILRTVRTNLGWAFGYNLLALPIAAAGLLNPMLAGAAMAASSVLVVLNSLRLRRPWRSRRVSW